MYLRNSVLPPRQENRSFYNPAKNLVIYGYTLNITKRLDRNFATFVTTWQRKNTYPNFKRHAEEKVYTRCCLWPFCMHTKWPDNHHGRFYITELYVQKPISNKTFNVKTMVHLNNWTCFGFLFGVLFCFYIYCTIQILNQLTWYLQNLSKVHIEKASL